MLNLAVAVLFRQLFFFLVSFALHFPFVFIYVVSLCATFFASFHLLAKAKEKKILLCEFLCWCAQCVVLLLPYILAALVLTLFGSTLAIWWVCVCVCVIKVKEMAANYSIVNNLQRTKHTHKKKTAPPSRWIDRLQLKQQISDKMTTEIRIKSLKLWRDSNGVAAFCKTF